MRRAILATTALSVILLVLPGITAGRADGGPLPCGNGPAPTNIGNNNDGSPEPADEANDDGGEGKEKRITNTEEMLDELLRQLEEFGEHERHGSYSDILKRFREMLERLEKVNAALELRDFLTTFGKLFLEAFLESRDFHYDLKLGEIEYRISAMNRHRLEKLGLKVENISPAMEAQLGLEGKGGVLVAEVGKDGLAAKAGLKKYDILMSIGESDVPGIDKIDKVLGALPAEKELTCNIIRNAKEKEIKMTLPKGLRSGNEPENDQEEDADGNDEEQND